MEPYQIALIVIGALVIITVIGMIMARNARKNQYYKLLATFGQLKKIEFEYTEYESISHFYKNTLKDGENHIDDTTWNDLDMDKVFMMINNTNSSVGRDYLYKLLRMPVSDKTVLKERDRLIEFFDSNDDARTRIMQDMSMIGFTKKLSISDHMQNLFKLRPMSNTFHYLMNVCIVLALLYTIFVDPVMGILLMLISIGASIITYYKIKGKIENYFSCIHHFVGMVCTAKKISAMNLPELEEYNEFFNATSKKFAKITRNSFLLVSMKNNSGSLADIFMEYIRMFTHVDIIKFNSMVRKIDNNYDAVIELMDKLGLMEAMISVANFRRLLPYMCKPEFDNDAGMDIKNVYHLSIKEPVPNSINETKPVLITGSNASGKSTFLKSVAINAILAQTIYTCPAEFYKAPFYRIYSSMALADDLDAGESYYIVEIKSLKRIVDAARTPGSKILCFVDEVLRGTNTVERIAASSEILKDLSENGVMCFAATHDIELTHILEKYYSNYHFSEEVIDNNVVFSYEIQNGRSNTRNAIKLLEIIGYDSEIIKSAESSAQDFLKTGVWREC